MIAKIRCEIGLPHSFVFSNAYIKSVSCENKYVLLFLLVRRNHLTPSDSNGFFFINITKRRQSYMYSWDAIRVIYIIYKRVRPLLFCFVEFHVVRNEVISSLYYLILDDDIL